MREAWPYRAAHRFLLFDRDAKFGDEVVSFARELGSLPVLTAFRSPWQNGVAERWVGNCRRDLLDDVITMARDSQIDRAIWIVQTRLAKNMAVCRRKRCQHRCFFRTRKGQKYCSEKCAYLVRVAGKLSWYHEVGSEQRRQKSLR